MNELALAVTLRHEKGNITLFGQRNIQGNVQGNEDCKTSGIQLNNTSVGYLNTGNFVNILHYSQLEILSEHI
jgi:hypothetical protein